MIETLPKVFCAIDTPDLNQAVSLISSLSAAGCGVKLGLEFFSAHGPHGVRNIMEKCGRPPVFLDLKYHDIPNTVAGAVRAASELGVLYLNVHASGGLEMMCAAKEACAPGVRLLAVTLLTSLDEQAIAKIGYQKGLESRVRQMALLTQEAGLDGIVCSAREVRLVREACGPDFILMVPGIRPAGADTQDQKRSMTPQDALNAGATHLVIGRPITQADNPAAAAEEILKSL